MAKNEGVWVERAFMRNRDLSGYDKLILAVIDSLDRAKGCFASNQYIAELCGCSKRSVSNSIARGVAMGWLVVRQERGDYGERRRVIRLQTGEKQRQQEAKWRALAGLQKENEEKRTRALALSREKAEAEARQREEETAFEGLDNENVFYPLESEAGVCPLPMAESPLPTDVTPWEPPCEPERLYDHYVPTDVDDTGVPGVFFSAPEENSATPPRKKCTPPTQFFPAKPDSFHLLYDHKVDRTVDHHPAGGADPGEGMMMEAPAREKKGPTLDMVRGFCKAMGYSTDPEEFWQYYELEHWTVGGEAVSNWKALLGGWERRCGDVSSRTGNVRKKIGFAAERMDGGDGTNPEFNEWWSSVYHRRLS